MIELLGVLLGLAEPVHHVELFPGVRIALKLELHVVGPGPLSSDEGNLEMLFLRKDLFGHLFFMKFFLLPLDKANSFPETAQPFDSNVQVSVGVFQYED